MSLLLGYKYSEPPKHGRCGFLGLLHLDVFRQRLSREYGSSPAIGESGCSPKWLYILIHIYIYTFKPHIL